MKKKLKLFASLASLCLSLAVLCFGVYAAIKVDYSLSGSVNYNVDNVFVKVETKLFWYENNVIPTDLQTPANNLKNTGAEDDNNYIGLVESYQDTPYLSYENGVVLDAGQNAEHSSEDIQIKYGAYSNENPTTAYAYFIVVEITNYGTETINAVLTNNTTGEVNSNEYITPNINIQGRGEKEYTIGRIVIALTLNDPTISVNGVEFYYDIAISQGQILQETSQGTLNLLDKTDFAIVNDSSEIGEEISIVSQVEYINYMDNILPAAIYNFNLLNIPENRNSLSLTLTSQQQETDLSMIGIYVEKDNCQTATQFVNDLQNKLIGSASNVYNQPGTEFTCTIDFSSRDSNTFSFVLGIVFAVELEPNSDVTASITTNWADLELFSYNLVEEDGRTFYEISKGADLSTIVVDLEIPDSYTDPETQQTYNVEKIADYGFSSCTFKSVKLSDNIRVIGGAAFKLSNIMGNVDFGNGLEDIYGNAFQECFIETVEIPKSVEYIGSQAFFWSTLKNITFEENSNLKTIADQAFWDCPITSIEIPASVQTIDHYAFENCDDLQSLTFDSNINLQDFNVSMISFCDILSSIEIPASVNNIVTYDSSNLSNGTSGICLNNLTVNDNNQTYTSKDANGNELNCIMTIDRSQLVLGCKSTNLETLPTTITTIKSYAFTCSLTEIIIIETITTIEDCAFYDGNNDITVITLNNLSIANSIVDRNSIGSALSCGYANNKYAVTIKVKCSALSEITSTLLLDATAFTQPTELDSNGYAVFVPA